jgi:hypothetical protein
MGFLLIFPIEVKPLIAGIAAGAAVLLFQGKSCLDQ